MSSTTHREFDVFLSFSGRDTRRCFISFFYKELCLCNIRTFKDDKELQSGESISPELIRAIEESRFAVVVVSENYTASPWCLDELVKIMEVREKGFMIDVMPIFYGVNPTDVRRQNGKVAEHFEKHDGREDPEKVSLWKQALTNLASISGDCSSKWENDSEMVDEITERISKKLMIAKPKRSGSKLVEIDRHMKALRRKLDLNSKKSVRVFGIWSRGSYCRSVLAKFLYQDISQHFECHCFLESVKRISQDRHMWHLRQEFLKKIQGDYSSTLRLKNQKVLLVADDVCKLEQIEALAEEFINFGPGSLVIITTQDKQLFKSYGIKDFYEVDLLRFKISELFRQLAFNERDISAAFKSAFFMAKKWFGYVVNLVMKIFRINI